MKNIFFALLALLLASCASKDSTQKRVIKTIDISGKISSVLFKDGGYCYTLIVPNGHTIPLCSAKEHYIIGDTISYKKDRQGIISTKLIKPAASKPEPIKKGTKPKNSKISIPKNQTISFD